MRFFKYLLICFVVTFIISASYATSENLEQLSPDLYEAFYGAIESDNFLEIKQFLNFGVDINHRYNGGLTPLMVASRMECERAVKTLLDLGVDTEYVSEENMTALDYAEQNNNKTITSLLKTHSYTNKKLIKEIQFYLQKLDYNTGEIDGVIGNKTTSALKKFVRDTNQSHPGEISHRQVEILKNAYFSSR